jgi:carbamoylphosphate synthase large subunit
MTSRDKASLLLLSGGSLVGQNIVQGLAHRRSALRLVVTNSLGDEPSLADFDAVYLVPSTRSHPTEFAQTVEELIDSEKPDLVIPCRDDDVLVIALLAQRRPDLASRLLCGSVDVARATLDKWLGFQFSQTHGLPFVPTWVPNETASIEEFIIEQGFPLLIKPRLGFASSGVRIVLNRQQLESAIDDKSVLVQRYLGDTGLLQDYLANMEAHGVPLFHSLEEVKHSLQGMIDPNGEIVGVYTTLHRMAQGISLDIIQDTR